jgi:hypothetical protein
MPRAAPRSVRHVGYDDAKLVAIASKPQQHRLDEIGAMRAEDPGNPQKDLRRIGGHHRAVAGGH